MNKLYINFLSLKCVIVRIISYNYDILLRTSVGNTIDQKD